MVSSIWQRCKESQIEIPILFVLTVSCTFLMILDSLP
jgi:hypothetical protein